MGSQTGMSPKLSPEPLKMSLPSINCHDSKTNGHSLSIRSFPPLSGSSPYLPISPFPQLPQSPFLCVSRDPRGILTRLDCARRGGPLPPHTDRWGRRKLDKCQRLKTPFPDWSEPAQFPSSQGLCASRAGRPWNGWKSPSGGLPVAQSPGGPASCLPQASSLPLAAGASPSSSGIQETSVLTRSDAWPLFFLTFPNYENVRSL